MKFTKTLLLLFIAINFIACDAITGGIKDAATVDLDTDFVVNITMAEDSPEIGLKSLKQEYTFNDDGILTVNSVAELEDFIDGISNIAFNSTDATVTGLEESEVIETINVVVKIGDNEEIQILSASGVDSDSGSLPMSNVDQVESQWKQDYKQELSFSVSGTRNFTTAGHAPVNTNLLFESTVSYALLGN